MRILPILLVALCVAGCFQPDYPKIVAELSDENFELDKENQKLKGQLADRAATIRNLQEIEAQRLPRVATLPEARLKQLLTVGRVQIRGMTDAWDFNGDGKQDGFRVFVRPQTEDGATLPATGTLTVEAFDLAKQEGAQRLGKWTFTPEQLKPLWYAGFGLDHFAVNCRWEAPPAHRQVVFKIQFIDALTGKVFVDQKTIDLHLPPKG